MIATFSWWTLVFITITLFCASNGFNSSFILFNLSLFQEFYEPPVIDLDTVEEFHLFVVARNHTIDGEFTDNHVATMLTRLYCYSTEINSTKFNESTCNIPGPTLLMHSLNKIYNVFLHNELQGIGKHKNIVQLYGDPDTINLHTHGLHVNPNVDDIVDIALNPKCPPMWNTTHFAEQLECETSAEGAVHHYKYNISTTHYPGTHWYHAHKVCFLCSSGSNFKYLAGVRNSGNFPP